MYLLSLEVGNGYHCNCCRKTWTETEEFGNSNALFWRIAEIESTGEDAVILDIYKAHSIERDDDLIQAYRDEIEGKTKDFQDEEMKPDDPLVMREYVLATKYTDGSPCDLFCVGFYDGLARDDPPHNPPRYNVVDGEGNKFGGDGFRRVERIDFRVGDIIVAAMPIIGNREGPSLWY